METPKLIELQLKLKMELKLYFFLLFYLFLLHLCSSLFPHPLSLPFPSPFF